MRFGLRGQNWLVRAGWFSIAVAAALLLCLFSSPAIAQQPAAKPHRPAFHGFVQPEPINFDDHDGWTQIFDGKTLKDWDGDRNIWHVETAPLLDFPRASFRHDKHHLARRRARKLRTETGDETRRNRRQWRPAISQLSR